MKKKPHQYISVMGTMGSGKTTAARLIADHFHYHLIEENFGENAFLPRFYKTMDRWAFHSQTFYLMEKITQMMETKTLVEKVSVVQDTPLVQDVFSYAKAQHVMHHMDDAEWRLYQKIYTSFLPYIPVPDCIVYLKTSVPVVQKRIASRGRGYEQAIPKAYVSLLESLNESWLRDQHSIPVITIETDTLNIVKSSKARELFLSQLSFSHS